MSLAALLYLLSSFQQLFDSIFFFIAFHSSSFYCTATGWIYSNTLAYAKASLLDANQSCQRQPKYHRQIYSLMSTTQYHAICFFQKSGICCQLSCIWASITEMESLGISRLWEPHDQIYTLVKAGRRQHLSSAFQFPFLHSFPALFSSTKTPSFQFLLLLSLLRGPHSYLYVSIN